MLLQPVIVCRHRIRVDGIGSRYSIDMAVSCGYEGHHFNGSEASWYVEGGRDYLTVMMM